MKVGDLVELEWDDHCTLSPNGWTERQEEYLPCVCRTVGYIVALDRKTVTMTATYDTESTTISGYMVRLRSAITKAKVLKGLK